MVVVTGVGIGVGVAGFGVGVGYVVTGGGVGVDTGGGVTVEVVTGGGVGIGIVIGGIEVCVVVVVEEGRGKDDDGSCVVTLWEVVEVEIEGVAERVVVDDVWIPVLLAVEAVDVEACLTERAQLHPKTNTVSTKIIINIRIIILSTPRSENYSFLFI